jgi:leucine-rich PPR motif-containing protein
MSGRVSAAADRCLVRPPSARELLFSTDPKADAAPFVPVPVAPPLARPRPVGMLGRVSAAADRCLQLERFIAGRAQSGSLGPHDALKLFDLLLPHARPSSVTAFNQLLVAVSRASGRRSSTSESQLGISLFNRMVHECSDKVAPNMCTYNILIRCFCRMGRLEHGFAAFGLILKTGWRVNDSL